MSIKTRNALICLPAALLALSASAALGQSVLTGTSHPAEEDVTVIQDGVTHSVVYTKPGTSTPWLDAPPQPAVAPPRLDAAPADRAPGTPPAAAPTHIHDVARPADVDADMVTRIPVHRSLLPEGTLLRVRMIATLSTKGTTVGTSFQAELTAPIQHQGEILIPAHSLLLGKVTDVHAGTRMSGPASIHLQPQSITLPNGTRYSVTGKVIDTNLYRSTKVDREGTIIRRDHPKETFAAVSVTTASATAAGAVIGGGVGAVIGAGIGAGVSTAWWLRQDRETALPADSKITFTLTAPMQVGDQ